MNRGRGNNELAPSAELFTTFREAKTDFGRTVGKGTAGVHNRVFVAGVAVEGVEPT